MPDVKHEPEEPHGLGFFPGGGFQIDILAKKNGNN